MIIERFITLLENYILFFLGELNNNYYKILSEKIKK